MPPKYHIHTKPTPPRFRPIGKLGIVEWREDCSNCHNCVKRGCVYGFYRDEADTLREERDYLDYIYQCKGCLTCVQNCTKGILTRVVNPEYKRLGDEYFTPEILLTTWFQAEAGAIPVSGSGYGGPFSGEGFDSMWTDMSEIVRPTRDGIHGREYISTSVDIGRKPGNLIIEDGLPVGTLPPLIESPVPLIFEALPEHFLRGPVLSALTRASAELGIFAIIRGREIPEAPHVDPNVPPGIAGGRDLMGWPSVTVDKVVPLLNGAQGPVDELLETAPMAMIEDGDGVDEKRAELKKKYPNLIVAIRVPATPGAAERIVELARDGAEVIHLLFDSHGKETDCEKPRHARDVLREVHGALTHDGTRDQITLVSSGGIALPEHAAKAILCGADLVTVDLPLLVALECRLCGECERGGVCPIGLEEIDAEFAFWRICNLMAAWHNQLLELLGAMGIREMRRLRGETGRCMFFEDLEAETFGRLFGKRKDQNGA